MKWSDSLAAKSIYGKAVNDVFTTWDVLWDNTSYNTLEFVAKRGSQYAYIKHLSRHNDAFLSLSDSEKAKFLAHKIELFDDVMDFRSFIEVKNDNRLRKLVV
jgi:hypothetical protein